MNGPQRGGDRDQLYLISHSSGSHLASCGHPWELKRRMTVSAAFSRCRQDQHPVMVAHWRRIHPFAAGAIGHERPID